MARLLLVDDDEANRLTLAVVLEDEGLEVAVAASFTEAQRLLRAPDANYDLVLLDQNLGDGRGVDLVPTIRERMPGARTVIVSGSSTAESCREWGVDGYIAKGTRLEEVLAFIHRIISGSSSRPT